MSKPVVLSSSLALPSCHAAPPAGVLRSPLLLCAVLALCGACPSTTESPLLQKPDPGALVEVSFSSTTGVLLEDIPAGPARERAAARLVGASPEYWQARIHRQVDALGYHLNHRRRGSSPGIAKDSLPLPPRDAWNITVEPAGRTTIDGHDYVAVTYSFATTLLGPRDAPGKSDPILAELGGVLEEAVSLPADPEHLLERTGFACMNESEAAPSSIDSENARWFFDHTCTGGTTGTASGEGEQDCHGSRIVDVDCIVALRSLVGAVDVGLRFERVVWNAARASSVRTGEQIQDVVQLRAVASSLADRRIVSRYFSTDSCAIADGCVQAPGWRRLLQLTSTVQNIGARAASLGEAGPGSFLSEGHVVSTSTCGQEQQVRRYGRFVVTTGDTEREAQRSSCMTSTTRSFNNEDTPFAHPYSCAVQGIAPGWSHDALAGGDCQWVDITALETTGGVPASLRFEANPDDILCEGTPKLDDNGDPLLEPAEGLVTPGGEPESRFQCEFLADHALDNTVAVDVELSDAQGGVVTEPCLVESFGDKKNCDFEQQGAPLSCTPGSLVAVQCVGSDASPAAVRVCEASQILHGIPCMFGDALATTVQTGSASTLTFSCPSARDAVESGGRFSVFIAPMVPDDDVGGVQCSIAP
jgi:hypothetical protein